MVGGGRGLLLKERICIGVGGGGVWGGGGAGATLKRKNLLPVGANSFL